MMHSSAPMGHSTPIYRSTHGHESRAARVRLSALIAVAMLTTLVPGAARADGLTRLKTFMNEARAGQSAFVQQLTSRDGKLQPPVSGELAFQRPGKFRWDVQKPYHQLIVADGAQVWLWDPDLNQATVKPQDKTLGVSPAALLAGDNARLERDFVLREAPPTDGLEWVEATPRSNEAGFDSVLLGFSGAVLARMNLKDSFGQWTRIRFSHFQVGGNPPAESFRFHPPAGADVVRE